MRHRKKGKKLNRDRDHRVMLLRNLAKCLIFHEEIITTQAKASQVARFTERLITLAKRNSLHHRRLVLRFIGDKEITRKLFSTIVPRYQERQGGYTQIIKMGYRQGDNASQCKLKLV